MKHSENKCRREETVNGLEIEQHPDFDGHETVVFSESEPLKAIVAVHNSHLGPAVGGCRMYPYSSVQAALTDVLRLSRGMTYKSALAGLPLGGGKSVIIGDPRKDKTRELMLSMGEFVDSLKGRYVTAEDSGTSVTDIATIGERTQFVSGVSEEGPYGGDPSPMTAYGVLIGITAAVRHRCDTDLKGIRVAVQGVGNVGYHLTKMLLKAGATVSVADISAANLKRVSRFDGVEIVSVDDILKAEADVLAPCALGGAINPETVREIRAGIIAGAANNQLATSEMGQVLVDRGILYAPDYVINAGGIIDIYHQRRAERRPEIVNSHIERIGNTLKQIFSASEDQDCSTQLIADEMAVRIFNPEGDSQPLSIKPETSRILGSE